MTKTEICDQLRLAQGAFESDYLREIGWHEYVRICNALSCRTTFAGWSKQRLEDTLEIARKSAFVWRHITDERITEFVNKTNQQGYCYNEDIEKAYDTLMSK